MLNGAALPLKYQLSSLGLLLDLTLLLEQLMAVMARSAFYHLQQVHQLHPSLGKKELSTLIHALFTFSLDDYQALSVRLSLESAPKLKLVQNAVAWLLAGGCRF